MGDVSCSHISLVRANADAVNSDFADEHPSSEVVGVDLSPIQPNFIPPNVRFEVDDINKPWTFKDNYFDYVHARSMLGTVPDWTEFWKSAKKYVHSTGD